MSKCLTFEKWKDTDATDGWLYGDFWDQHELTWEAARQGMIPDSEAIRIPPAEEWPVWATYIMGEFSSGDGVNHACDPAFVIPRPTPKWVPKVGDKVFIHYNPTIVGTIIKPKEGNAPFIIVANGNEESIHTIGMIKPLSVDHIGKPWDEIPNA